jgi:hypothetical protein
MYFILYGSILLHVYIFSQKVETDDFDFSSIKSLHSLPSFLPSFGTHLSAQLSSALSGCLSKIPFSND